MTIVLAQYQDYGTRFRVIKSAQSLFGRIQRLAGDHWLHDRDANLAEGKLCEQLAEAIQALRGVTTLLSDELDELDVHHAIEDLGHWQAAIEKAETILTKAVKES